MKPGVLQYMGSRRVGHDGTTEQQQPLAFREKGSRQVVIQKTEYSEGLPKASGEPMGLNHKADSGVCREEWKEMAGQGSL